MPKGQPHLLTLSSRVTSGLSNIDHLQATCLSRVSCPILERQPMTSGREGQHENTFRRISPLPMYVQTSVGRGLRRTKRDKDAELSGRRNSGVSLALQSATTGDCARRAILLVGCHLTLTGHFATSHPILPETDRHRKRDSKNLAEPPAQPLILQHASWGALGFPERLGFGKSPEIVGKPPWSTTVCQTGCKGLVIQFCSRRCGLAVYRLEGAIFAAHFSGYPSYMDLMSSR